MVDYELKINDILNDYYSTIGKFNNVSKLIELKEYEIKATDDEETKKVKEGQQREILIDLGRIAEMAFKYIIKIKRMELYPQETYLDSVDVNNNTIKGFKEKETLTAAVIRDLGNKVRVSKEDIDSILNVSGIGPKAHNFNYLYLIIDKLMPEVRDKFNEVCSINIKSQNAKKVLSHENDVDNVYVVFPNSSIKTSFERDEEQKQIIEMINKRNQTINDSGDIFTRLRYYANNPFDKNFSIQEVYNMVSNIILFIKLIRLNEENLYFDPEIAFSFYTLKNNPNLTILKADEIETLYSLEKIKNNVTSLMHCIFFTDLPVKQIISIINSDEIKEVDYPVILAYELTLETILYFKSIGIEDYDEMSVQIKRRMADFDKKRLNTIYNENYTLEEYKELKDKFNIEKYPKVLSLLDHISQNSVLELQKYPELMAFFINEFYLNVNKISYQYGDKMFKYLLSIEEVRNNPNAWYGLDTDQLQIYYNVSNLLLKNSLNEELINKGNYYYDIILENVKENINYFKNNQKLLCVLPLMLDCEDNKHILNILIRNGLNIKDLRGFDSTIFCIPAKLVDVIEKIFKAYNIPLIVNNKVNPDAFGIIGMINETLKGDIKFKTRRVPFYKSEFFENNPTNNPVINELLYDDDIKMEFSKETKQQFAELQDKIKDMSVEELTLYILRESVLARKTLKNEIKDKNYKK